MIGEEELKEKIRLLKENMRENSVTMAVGAIWKEDGKKHIDRLLSESEKLMYQDKAAYYKAAGIDRRK